MCFWPEQKSNLKKSKFEWLVSRGNNRNKTFLVHIFSYLGLKEVPKGLTVTQSGVNRDLNSPLLPYSHYTVISQIKVFSCQKSRGCSFDHVGYRMHTTFFCKLRFILSFLFFLTNLISVILFPSNCWLKSYCRRHILNRLQHQSPPYSHKI